MASTPKTKHGKKGISQEEMDEILKKIGIEYDAWPITKIIIENDLKLKKVFLAYNVKSDNTSLTTTIMENSESVVPSICTTYDFICSLS